MATKLFLENCIINDCKSNKKNMLEGVNNFVGISDEKTKSSIMFLEHLVEYLVNDGKLKLIHQENKVSRCDQEKNKYYNIILDGVATDIALIEPRQNRFKIIDVSVAEELVKYHFNYSYGTVYTSQHSIKITLEQAVLNLKSDRKIDTPLDMQIHHKWLRCSAMQSMIALMEKDMHKNLHKQLGNYAHNQKIEIRNEKNFNEFFKRVKEVDAICNKNYFCIEH